MRLLDLLHLESLLVLVRIWKFPAMIRVVEAGSVQQRDAHVVLAVILPNRKLIIVEF